MLGFPSRKTKPLFSSKDHFPGNSVNLSVSLSLSLSFLPHSLSFPINNEQVIKIAVN